MLRLPLSRLFRVASILSSLRISDLAFFAHAGSSSTCSGTQMLCEKTPARIVEDCHTECDGLIPDLDSKKCIERSVFRSSHLAHDLVAVCIWFVGAGLAMSAGVGGGGIYVPLGLILLRFGAKAATGLSQASIFGASLGGLWLNTKQRHPLADRPVIDLDMALFLAPMEMAGAVVGVIVQKILPDWAVILIMAVVLGYTAVRTFSKGRQVYAREVKDQQRYEEAMAEEAEQPGSSGRGSAGAEDGVGSQGTGSARLNMSHTLSGVDGDVYILETSAAESDEESKGPRGKSRGAAGKGEVEVSAIAVEEDHGSSNSTVPKKSPSKRTEDAPERTGGGGPTGVQTVDGHLVKGRIYTSDEWLAKDAGSHRKAYAYLACLWVFLILIFVFRGGKGMESAIKDVVPYCGVVYWILGAVAFLWLFGFGAIMGKRAVSKSIRRQQVGVPTVEGDVEWDYPRVFFYAKWTFFAGNIATSEVFTPRPITPTFGCAKETHPHSVGSWPHDVRRDVSWWCVVETSRGRGVVDVHTIRVLRLRGVVPRNS